LPLAWIFGFVTFLRNRIYDLGFIKPHNPQKHTICVGNLSVGGSGKTPHVEYLINLLKAEFSLATLSRGYKRKTTGFIIADNQSTAEDIGDEPLLYKTKHSNLTVCVEVNRVKGVKKLAVHEPFPEVIYSEEPFSNPPN